MMKQKKMLYKRVRLVGGRSFKNIKTGKVIDETKRRILVKLDDSGEELWATKFPGHEYQRWNTLQKYFLDEVL